jgi:hypothetical protein
MTDNMPGDPTMNKNRVKTCEFPGCEMVFGTNRKTNGWVIKSKK